MTEKETTRSVSNDTAEFTSDDNQFLAAVGIRCPVVSLGDPPTLAISEATTLKDAAVAYGGCPGLRGI